MMRSRRSWCRSSSSRKVSKIGMKGEEVVVVVEEVSIASASWGRLMPAMGFAIGDVL